MKNFYIFISFFIFLFFGFNLNAEVTIASWGGTYKDVQKLSYGDPYIKKTGVKINWLNWNDYPIKDFNEIKKQIKLNQIKWDIVDLFLNKDIKLSDINKACHDDFFVSFDFDNDFYPSPEGILLSKDYFTNTLNNCLIGNLIFSWNYGYNTEIFSKGPRTIKDFFDTVKFPGKRGLYNNPRTNIEMALVADGVFSKVVYTVLNNQSGAIDRAIEKIKSLCNDPKGGCIFWSTGTKPAELLISKKVVMSTAWSNRLFTAEIDEDKPIKQVWDGQVLDYEFFAVINDSSNKKEAMEVLRYFTSTEASAALTKQIPYAPWRKSALDIIKAGEPWYKDGKTNILNYIPTAYQNTQNYILTDYDYWLNHSIEIEKKWVELRKNIK